MNLPTCENCPWFAGFKRTLQSDPGDTEEWGLCRRLPPRPGRDVGTFNRSCAEAAWPRVAVDDACGEHPRRQPRTCPACKGTGLGRLTFKTACKDCYGAGSGGRNDIQMPRGLTCGTCLGSGHGVDMVDVECEQCHGIGRTYPTFRGEEN